MRQLKHMKEILEALLDADPPMTTNDFQVLIPDINDRTLRRRLSELATAGALTQIKGGRGYGQGVANVIEHIDRVKIRELQTKHGLGP